MLVSSVKFESAARAKAAELEPADENEQQEANRGTSPPLASGRFVDCHAVRRLKGVITDDDSGAKQEGVLAVADAIEAAWKIVRGDGDDDDNSATTVVMVPMLLSPLHKLRMYFSAEAENGHAVAPAIADGIQALAKRLVAQQVADSTAAALAKEKKKKKQAASEDGDGDDGDDPGGAVDADVGGEWPYNKDLPTLLLVDSKCAARIEKTSSYSGGGGGEQMIVCNPQTPVRDWFRVLNHDLSHRNEPTRLLPLLTVEGTAGGSDPVYCAVRVPQSEDYHNKHQELRQWGVDHSKDPGLQWQVMCDYTKIAMKDMQARGIDFEVHKLVMSHDRSLRGVLLQNYTDDDLRALRDKFGMRWLDESA